MEVLQSKALLPLNTEDLLHPFQSNLSPTLDVVCHTGACSWFERVEADTVHHAMCCGDAKLCCSENGNNGILRAVGLSQVLLIMTGSIMKCGAAVLAPLKALVLKVHMAIWQNHIFYKTLFVGLNLGDYKEDDRTFARMLEDELSVKL